jgi:hypothetical protein
MKKKTKKSKCKEHTFPQETYRHQDDFFQRCLQKKLIEKTAGGFYFTPEFFELLNNRSLEYSNNDKKTSGTWKRF